MDSREQALPVSLPPASSALEANGDAAISERMPRPCSPVYDLQHCLVDLRERIATGASDGETDVLLRRAISLAELLVHEGTPRAAPGPLMLVVGPRGESFSVDGGERISLRRRRALPGILDALAKASTRAFAPQRSLAYADLVAAGWPGERVLPKAAELRVRAAIATLRTLGLREVLVTTSTGYALEGRIVLTPEANNDAT